MHQIDVLKTELSIKSQTAQQKTLIKQDLISTVFANGNNTSRDDLNLKLKQQQNEFIRKEVKLQQKIAQEKESVRHLEERVNDDKKVVENLKLMN